MSRIYTRRGDEGRTSLLGGARVSKTDARVDAYGTVDELNAAVGLALAVDDGELGDDEARLERVQDDLFAVGARLAADDPHRADEKGLLPDFPSDRVGDLEAWIDALDEELPDLDAFIHPGGSPAGAHLHAARTVGRRAERTVTALAGERPELREVLLPYLNRLSDLLFTLARAVNRRAGSPEVRWTPVRERRVEPEDGSEAADDARADDGEADGGEAGEPGGGPPTRGGGPDGPEAGDAANGDTSRGAEGGR